MLDKVVKLMSPPLFLFLFGMMGENMHDSEHRTVYKYLHFTPLSANRYQAIQCSLNVRIKASVLSYYAHV